MATYVLGRKRKGRIEFLSGCQAGAAWRQFSTNIDDTATYDTLQDLADHARHPAYRRACRGLTAFVISARAAGRIPPISRKLREELR